MGRFSRLSEPELDALMAGKAPREDLDDLAAFLRDTAVVFQEATGEATERRHLAAMAETARLLADGDETLVATREPAQKPRRKFMSRKLLVPVAAGLLLALSAFGGVAYAGALPDPVQTGVADVADNLGVSLPDGDDGPQNDKDDGQVGNVDEGPTVDTDDDAVENRDDGPVEDRDEGQVGNADDGAKDDKDDGVVEDKDDGPQNEKDNGPAVDKDDGQQSNVGQQQSGDHDDGPNDVAPERRAPSPSGGGDQGQQGDGQQGDGQNNG